MRPFILWISRKRTGPPTALFCRQADATDATVVTKDADFVINRTLHGSPHRLLVIATGNIDNPALIKLIEGNLAVIEQALASRAHVELSMTSLTIHE